MSSVNGAMGAEPAIVVESVRKTYGELAAVDDVSCTVASGEFFGILGPNGVGKTTLLGLLRAAHRPEQIRTFAALYDVSPARADEWLERVALTDKAGTRTGKLSGASCSVSRSRAPWSTTPRWWRSCPARSSQWTALRTGSRWCRA